VIPIGTELRAAIDAMPVDRLTFITTAQGEPFSLSGFTNWFRARCQEAGLPLGYSVHGLRKAMCRRLAEAGCTEKQIAAISGHKTLRMVQHYTAAADQKSLARAAIERLPSSPIRRAIGGKPVPPADAEMTSDGTVPGAHTSERLGNNSVAHLERGTGSPHQKPLQQKE
jgi:Phage integrase family